MGATWSLFRPPPPTLTAKNLPDQSNKVFIVTGGSSGIGLELASILYHHNAKVYIAARNLPKIATAIDTIKSRGPTSTGSLHPLHLDLADLTTIKSSAETFLKENNRLDILWNNAGVMIPPEGSKTKQGYDLQLGTNTIAPQLFSKLLQPLLSKTASTSPANTVRIIWVSSSVAELMSPPGGIDLSNLDYHVPKPPWTRYGISKAGNIFQASEFGRRYNSSSSSSSSTTTTTSTHGIVSISLNPGNLNSDLQRHIPKWQMWLLKRILYEPVFGAYTELWAAFSPDVTVEMNGAFVAPWGYVKPLRKDLQLALKAKGDEGGSGIAGEFWEWCERQVAAFV